MLYVNQGSMPGPNNLFLIAEQTKSGTLTAYYKGYYNHKFKRYTLYPYKLINTLVENFEKKTISSLDIATK